MKPRNWNSALLTFALLVGCLSIAPQAADQGTDQQAAQLFPTPEKGMTIPGGGEQEMSIAEMILEFGMVTGEHFIWAPDQKAVAEATSVGFDRDLEIEAEDLYSVVETILLAHDFVLVDLRRAEPRMMKVIHTHTNQRGELRETASYVPIEDLPLYASHPALMISTTLVLEHLDARTLTNTLRALITDPNTLMTVLIPGSNSVILTGFTTTVIDLVQMLRRIDENASRFPVPSPPPGAGE
jgi:hypothetical protein